MIRRLSLGTHDIEYHVVRSKRIKTSEIIVEPKRVIVRTPLHKTSKEVEEMVKRKAEWIARKRLEYQQLVLQIVRPSYEPDSTLPYLGKNYPLSVLTGYKGDKIRFVGREFLVTISSLKHNKKRTRLLYEDWLMKKAEAMLHNKVKQHCDQLGVRPRQVLLKKLRKRWGSATKNDVLNLNINLLKAPEDVIDYVVLHEICHLKIRNHSHHFWDLVRKFMPNYKQRESWLSKNSIGLVE